VASQRLTAVEESTANPELGRTTVDLVAMMRLTEVEVHGTDLDVGLDDWSDVFGSNDRAIDTAVTGSWLFAATDGPRDRDRHRTVVR